MSNREIELKFAVGEAGAGALAEVLGLAEGKTKVMTAIYYDTPGRDLRTAGFGLRIRQSGDSFTQTLKSGGAGGFSRGEWETPAQGFAIDRKALADTPAAHVADPAALVPAFAIRVTRQVRVVEEGGSKIEVALDVGEAEAEGRRDPIRELEVELVSGDTADLFALARRLTETADLTLSFTSKAHRGFALADGEGARTARPETLDRRMTAGQAFQAIAHAALQQAALAGEVLSHRDDAEAVHRLRVGLRRLRSALSSFRKVSADGRQAEVKAGLKWLSKVMDRARDLDVFIAETFERGRAAIDADAQAALMARLKKARASAYAAIRKALASARYRALLLETGAWLEAGPWTRGRGSPERDEPVRDFAAWIMDRRLRGILRKGPHIGELAPDPRHRLRIAIKKLRYDVEAFAGLYGRKKKTRRFVEAVKALQEALGVLNDLAAGGVLAASLVKTGQAAFAAGEIVGAAHAREPELVEVARKAFADLEAAEPFWRR